METLDWGYCPELAFVKGQPYFKTLEENDPRAAFAFAKFIQIIQTPGRKPDPVYPKGKWEVPGVADEAVFWYQLLKGTPGRKLGGEALVKLIEELVKLIDDGKLPGVPKDGALHLALKRL